MLPNKINRLFVTLMFSLGLLVLALGVSEMAQVGAAPLYTEVSGTIDTDTTWNLAGSPYILTDNLIVAVGATLTVKPGVVVKGRNSGVELRVEGNLNATGTAEQPITFTSEADSASGEWGGITFSNFAATGYLEHVIVRYGGGSIPGYESANIRVYSNMDLQIIRSEIINASAPPSETSYGLFAQNGIITINDTLFANHGNGVNDFGFYAQDSTLNVTDSTFEDNSGMGFYADNSFVTVNSSTLQNNGSAGMQLLNNQSCTMNDSTFQNNDGSGLLLSNYCELSGNHFSDNASYPVETSVDNLSRVLNNTNTFSNNTPNRLLVSDGILLEDLNLTHASGISGLDLAGSFQIDYGFKLTIQQGFTIAGNSNGLIVHGHLEALGTASEPITLTARSGNGWGGLLFNNGGTGYLRHTTVSYGGYFGQTTHYGNINVLNGRLELESSQVLSSTGPLPHYDSYGLYIENGLVTLSDTLVTGNDDHAGRNFGLVATGDSHLTVTNSIFQNNSGDALQGDSWILITVTNTIFEENGGYGINSDGSLWLSDSQFINNGSYPLRISGDNLHRVLNGNNSFTGNSPNRLLLTSGTVMEDTTLSTESGLSGFEIGSLTVPSAVTLSIEPGLTVMGSELRVLGHLDAIGTASQPIIFTSALDSAPGQWNGLLFENGSGDLRHTTVRYGGNFDLYSNNATIRSYFSQLKIEDSMISSSDGWPVAHGLYAEDSELTILNSIFKDNTGMGMELDNSTADVQCGAFLNNQVHGIHIDNSNLSVLGAKISGNSGNALWNQNSGQVQAIYNWWGDASGPSGNGAGSGDEVMGDVEFTPWLRNSRCVVDLAIEKADTPEPVIAGTTLTYTLTVINHGPGEASELTVTDTLPAGVSFVSADLSQGTACVDDSGTVTCELGTLARNSSAMITMTTDVDPAWRESITNMVTVGSYETDYIPGNNESSEGTEVIPRVDVWVEKSDAPDPVIAGTTLTYEVTVTNDGPSSAFDVMFTDTLPATGVTYDSVTASQGNCSTDNALVRCDLGTLEPQSNALVTIEVSVDSAFEGTIENTAEAKAIEPDTDLANNSTSEETEVIARADLTIAKSDSPDPVIAGTTLTYMLTVTNNGPSDAREVSVSDSLPAGVSYQSATSSQGSCEYTEGDVTCEIGYLPVGAQVTMNVTVAVDSATLGAIINTAVVQSETIDPIPSNNDVDEETEVIAYADLSLVKSDSLDPVIAGTSLTYMLTVTNDGPSDARGVNLSDSLPPDVTFQSATVSQGSYNHTNGTVTYEAGTLAAGAEATISIVVTVDSSTLGTMTNTAVVESEATDTDLSNNNVEETTDVIARADLTISQSDSPDPVVAGTSLTYMLTIANNGPSDAKTVSVLDTLPSEVTFVSATASGGSCSESSGSVTCELGDIAANSQATISLVLMVKSDTLGAMSNTATVESLTTDPDSGNNSVNEETTVIAEADLSLSKSDSPDPVIAGTNLSYILTVANEGPSYATAVTLTDTLPAGVTFVEATGCTENEGLVTCDLGSMAPSTSKNVTIVVNVAPSTRGTITNQAEVSANVPDPVQGNNTTSEASTVNGEVDLSLTQSDSPDPVIAGTNLTYMLTATNNGPSDATNVTLIDTLPNSVSFISADATQGTCNEADGTVTCELGALAKDAQASLIIIVTPNEAGTISNSANVSADESDTNTANNSATESTTINPAADLSLLISDNPDPVLVGETLTYILTVENQGPSDATNVTLSDNLPNGTSFVSASSTQGTCNETNGIVTCELGALAKDAQASITIIITPNEAGTISNSASVSADESDTNTANNSATESTTIIPMTDLSLVISVDPDLGEVGERVTYTLTIDNNGPSEGSNVTVTDNLPNSVSFVSASSTQGTCNEANQIVTCEVGTLAKDTQATITIVVIPDQMGNLTNSANVYGDEVDPEISNDNGTTTIEVVMQTSEIDDTTGGSLIYTDEADNETMINVPAGAVDQPIDLAFMPLTPDSTPDGYNFAGHGFTLDAYQNGVMQENFAFNTPISITIHYSDDDVVETDENYLTLYYWDTGNSQWVDAASSCDPESTYNRHPEDNWMAVEICHLTQFGLFGSPPLLVQVQVFEANAIEEHVQINWTTVSELDNLGFNLYRSTEASELGEQLNENLIPSQAPGSGQGASYEFIDQAVEEGVTYYYTLESMTQNGESAQHGSISVTINTPAAVTLQSLATISSDNNTSAIMLIVMMLATALLWRQRATTLREVSGGKSER